MSDDPYTQAVHSGQYIRTNGLQGKYDNVRLQWEDEITRIFIRPYIEQVVQSCHSRNKKLRILDLGCGSGDGFEAVMEIQKDGSSLQENDTRLIKEKDLELYKGVDINESLLKQSEERFKKRENMVFEQCDLSQGLLQENDNKPYDIYFSSFGTWSHFHNPEAIHLLADIACHAETGSIVIADWLGRYSYEWQNLWNTDTTDEQWMDYRISYIYPKEERNNVEIENLPLRLMCKEEIEKIVRQSEKQSGLKIVIKKIFDRSILCGRHIDTGEYNDNPLAIRYGINALYENKRTQDLKSLLFDYHEREGFEQANTFFNPLKTEWNLVISFAIDLLENYSREKALNTNMWEIVELFPANVKEVLLQLKQTIHACEQINYGDTRAEVFERQLGYALRFLEIVHQRGEGYGHGICGIFEVYK